MLFWNIVLEARPALGQAVIRRGGSRTREYSQEVRKNIGGVSIYLEMNILYEKMKYLPVCYLLICLVQSIFIFKRELISNYLLKRY